MTRQNSRLDRLETRMAEIEGSNGAEDGNALAAAILRDPVLSDAVCELFFALTKADAIGERVALDDAGRLIVQSSGAVLMERPSSSVLGLTSG
jgi:hypothetical protein